jgi:hypothetical protein
MMKTLKKIYRKLKSTLKDVAIDRSLDKKVQGLRHKSAIRKTDVYYLIYRESTQAGFFSNLYVFFPEIASSINRGEIPVVDMLNFSNQSSSHTRTGINYWELIYEQPMGHALANAYSAKDLRHCYGCRRSNPKRLNWNMEWINDPELLQNTKHSFNSLVRLNSTFQEHINRSKIEIFRDFKSTIGVTLRGTDYTYKKPCGHPIQPCINSILDKCATLITSGEYDSIYLASIDRSIHSLFQRRFGDAYLCYKRPLYCAETDDLFCEIAKREDIASHYIDYVASIYLMSACKFVTGGIASSTLFLPLIANDDTSFDFPFLGYYS